MGYLQQKITNVETCYSFYNDNSLTTYQGTPTDKSMELWYDEYKTSFDHEKIIKDFEYKTKRPANSYDFHENGSIYFRPYYLPNTDEKLQSPSDSSVYDNWFYGTCRRCRLSKDSLNLERILVPKLFKNKDYDNDIFDLEIEWQEINGSITTTVHFPRRNNEIEPATIIVKDIDGNIIHDDSHTTTGKYLNIELVKTPVENSEDE